MEELNKLLEMYTDGLTTEEDFWRSVIMLGCDKLEALKPAQEESTEQQ